MSTGDPTARRVCLLTGAGSPLGNAFCRAYVAHYDIVAVCRTRVPDVPSQFERYVDPLEPAAEPAENANRVHLVYADLEQEGQVERVADLALARFGAVDVLVNNAAYTRLHRPGLIDDAGIMSDFDRHFAVNVGVPQRLAARLAELSWRDDVAANRERNRNIVNVSSLSASRVYAGRGQAVYAASKAALNQLTRHQAAEFAAFGVRANALAPTSFPTLVPTERVARAIEQLDGETVSGRVLVVDV